ncbi:MAG TPA: hypothetical protein VH234_02205 [Candidatus Saccharimonadales bacterium]|jgi:hypothetical protein|nr:hypothetical protein [Candidatus Saccharimonadales bacterium]
MADSKKTAKPINDVAHPDETAPETSSRPILVTNRPIIKDPMMVEGEKATSEMNEDTVKVKVQDHSELKLPATAAPEPPANEPAQPEAAPPEPAKETEPSTSEGNKDDTPDAEAIDEAEAAKQAEHDTAIQKLADSKQYFLPINAIEKRKSQRFVLLGIALSLLLAVAWVDVALDSGIIQINGIKPVTHFFSN